MSILLIYLSVHTSASLRDFVSLVNLLLSFFIFLKRFLELLSRTDKEYPNGNINTS